MCSSCLTQSIPRCSALGTGSRSCSEATFRGPQKSARPKRAGSSEIKLGVKVGYTEAEINAAIDQVETAKRNHPDGWGMLDALGLDPSGDFVLYAFENASSQMNRLNQED